MQRLAATCLTIFLMSTAGARADQAKDEYNDCAAVAKAKNYSAVIIVCEPAWHDLSEAVLKYVRRDEEISNQYYYFAANVEQWLAEAYYYARKDQKNADIANGYAMHAYETIVKSTRSGQLAAEAQIGLRHAYSFHVFCLGKDTSSCGLEI